MGNYLFVCKENLIRSPFAARWFDEYARQNGIKANVCSAGMYIRSDISTPVSEELVAWADRIVILDREMAREFVDAYAEHRGKVAAVHIDDKFLLDEEEDAVIDDVKHYGLRTLNRFFTENLGLILSPQEDAYRD